MEKKKFIKIGTATEHNTPLITDIIINSSLLYFISIGKVESSLVAPAAPIAANVFKYFTKTGIIIKAINYLIKLLKKAIVPICAFASDSSITPDKLYQPIDAPIDKLYTKFISKI